MQRAVRVRRMLLQLRKHETEKATQIVIERSKQVCNVHHSCPHCTIDGLEQRNVTTIQDHPTTLHLANVIVAKVQHDSLHCTGVVVVPASKDEV